MKLVYALLFENKDLSFTFLVKVARDLYQVSVEA